MAITQWTCMNTTNAAPVGLESGLGCSVAGS